MCSVVLSSVQLSSVQSIILIGAPGTKAKQLQQGRGATDGLPSNPILSSSDNRQLSKADTRIGYASDWDKTK